MILYVGATGLLGRTAVNELCSRNKQVRCFVRPHSDISSLNDKRIEVVRGNLLDTDSLSTALRGAHTVISSFATNIAKEHRVDALWRNDYEGNLSLIRLARQAGVKKFIFISYWGLAKFGDFEHGKIKKMVEDLLTVSGLDYTVLRVTTLATDMSLLLGNTLKKRSFAPVVMRKHERVRPILLEDLSWCIADACTNPLASCRIIEAAGEEEYSFLELQDLFRRAIGRPVRFVFVPVPLAYLIAAFIDFFTRNRYNARGLVSAFTGGSTCDITEMKKIFKLQQGSFARHLHDYFATGRLVLQPPRGLS